MNTISIHNLTKRATDIQRKMTLKIVGDIHNSQDIYESLLQDLDWRISDTVRSVETILRQHGQSPAGLSIRSRRAFQWAKFLSNKENLQTHLDTLQQINLYLPTLQNTCVKELSKIDFSFYHISPLYRGRPQDGIQKVVIGESFIFAPDQVLLALMEATLCSSANSEKDIIRNYTTTKEYQKVREELEYLSIPAGSFSVGTHHNLIDSYNRVNNSYFDGMITMPHLVWNSRLTHRKYGHFQEDTNTVLISRTLDHHRIPSFTVDYVMYHELLHKKLGVRKRKNRRFIHTREFKILESKFIDFNKAQKILSKLSRKNS